MVKAFDYSNLFPAAPELILLAGAVICLIVDFTSRKSSYQFTSQLSLVTLVLSFSSLFLYSEFNYNVGMFELTRFNFSVKLLILVVAILVFLISDYYFLHRKIHYGEFHFLFLTSTLFFLLANSSSNIIIIYLAMETAAISSYILCGLNRSGVESISGALKYFFLSAFASSVFLLGSAFLLGASGSLDLNQIYGAAVREGREGYFILGTILSLSALMFKVGLAPFHWWIADVYESVPAPVAAFLSSVAKIGYFWLLVRYVSGIDFRIYPQIQLFIISIGVLSVIIGCIAPLKLRSVKRILAFASVNQIGYIIIILGISLNYGLNDIYFYLATYIIANVGVFGIISVLESSGGAVTISAVKGLIKDNKALAVTFIIFLLSFSGIPLTAGFIGKYLVFSSVFSAGSLYIGIIVVIASLTSFYFYLKIISSLVSKETNDLSPFVVIRGKFYYLSFFGIIFSAVLTIVFGIRPDIVLFLGDIIQG